MNNFPSPGHPGIEYLSQILGYVGIYHPNSKFPSKSTDDNFRFCLTYWPAPSKEELKFNPEAKPKETIIAGGDTLEQCLRNCFITKSSEQIVKESQN